jgi:hypothetical protein
MKAQHQLAHACLLASILCSINLFGLAGCTLPPRPLDEVYAAQTQSGDYSATEHQVRIDLSLLAIETKTPIQRIEDFPDAGYALVARPRYAASNPQPQPPWSLVPTKNFSSLAGTQMTREAFMAWLHTLPHTRRTRIVTPVQFVTAPGQRSKSRKIKERRFDSNWEFDADGNGKLIQTAFIDGSQYSALVKEIPGSKDFLVTLDVALRTGILREWEAIQAHHSPSGPNLPPLNIQLPSERLRRMQTTMAVRDRAVAIVAHASEQAYRPGPSGMEASHIRRHLLLVVSVRRIGQWAEQPPRKTSVLPLCRSINFAWRLPNSTIAGRPATAQTSDLDAAPIALSARNARSSFEHQPRVGYVAYAAGLAITEKLSFAYQSTVEHHSVSGLSPSPEPTPQRPVSFIIDRHHAGFRADGTAESRNGELYVQGLCRIGDPAVRELNEVEAHAVRQPLTSTRSATYRFETVRQNIASAPINLNARENGIWSLRMPWHVEAPNMPRAYWNYPARRLFIGISALKTLKETLPKGTATKTTSE